MGQIMLNGNAYAGGMGSGCGCFIDTSNVIVPSTSSSPISYTATQDCAVVISAEMSDGSYIHVFIDNTIVCSYVSNEDATFCQTFFVRRGQNIGTMQFSTVTYNISYTVYGVIQGLDSTAQSRYSTSEKAVGVWIDGSTIYEKTYELSSELQVSNTAWTSTAITQTGISKILGVEIYGASNYQGSGLANMSSDTIQLQTTRNSTAYCKYFTMRYTKAST